MNVIRSVQWWIWVLLMTMAALLIFATNASSGRERIDGGPSTPGLLAME